MSDPSDESSSKQTHIGITPQQKANTSPSIFDKASKHVAKLLIAATVGYAAYLFIVFGTPTHPVTPSSTMTPEQVRLGFARMTGLIGFVAGLGLCYVDWRSLWQWTTSTTKQLVRRQSK